MIEGERRVALEPEAVKALVERGFEVLVEAGAGAEASYPDKQYAEAGAELLAARKDVWSRADLIFKVNAPTELEGGEHEADDLGEGKTLISFLWPGQNPELLERLAARKANVFAMDKVPRISRAQKMDALSSMANIAGYRAVIEAAGHFGSFFSGQITAAGRTRPAHVMIIGAGVAGLAAVAAARGLGAVVSAFDTRAAVKEQVESLGAKFLEVEFEESGDGAGGYAKVMSKEFIDAEMALFREQAPKTDIIVTTALIPGRPAPKLILADMVEMMRPGSVVVDLAAEQGGNCELTVPHEVVVKHDVTLVGLANLPSRLPTLASKLYARNLVNLLDEMLDEDDNLNLDLDNEVIRGCIVHKEGELLWPPPKIENPSPPQPKPAKAPEVKAVAEETAAPSAVPNFIFVSLVVAALVALGIYAPTDFLQHFTVFLLACVVGWHVVWNVAPALHTPLMSVTNAISGIILIGGMLLVGVGQLSLAMILGLVAVVVASINVAGGFLVTHRMLKMFRR